MLDQALSPLAKLRGRTYQLKEATRADPVAGIVEVMEAPVSWSHARPDFVLDLSGKSIPDWIGAKYELHGSYLCQHRDALVFGQNNTFDSQVGWGCETHAFRTQFLSAFQSPGSLRSFPGPRPAILQRDSEWSLSIDNLADSQVEQIKEPVFLATPLEPDNWGRWISTVVPKAIQFQRLMPHRKFFCRIKQPWQRAVLNELGIEDERLLNHNPGQTYFCTDVATVRYSETSMTVSSEEKNIYQKIAGPRSAAGLKSERVFVSRLSLSAKKPKYRVLLNEQELITGLEARGFAIIEPEMFTFTEQVAIFANARVVVGLGGAAMYNVVFCQPNTAVITIESSDTFIRPHARLFASSGHRYGVIFGREDQSDPASSHRRWSLDIPAAFEQIDRFVGHVTKV